MPTTTLPDAPTSDLPARKPKKPYTDDEVKALAEVMGRPEVGNNIAAAAAILVPQYGGDYQRWYKLAKSNEYLAAVHPSAKPESITPTDVDAINRPPLLTPTEQVEHRQLAKQERALAASDWKALGISDGQATRMLSMERFARLPLKNMVAVTHGGMMFAFAGLLEIYEKCQKKFIEGNLPPELDKEGNPRDPMDIERDWVYAMTAMTAELRNIKGAVDKANILMLKADQMEKDKRSGGKKGKPGFGALVAVKAEAGANVTISDGKQSS